jgi:hypothetical protein
LFHCLLICFRFYKFSSKIAERVRVDTDPHAKSTLAYIDTVQSMTTIRTVSRSGKDRDFTQKSPVPIAYLRAANTTAWIVFLVSLIYLILFPNAASNANSASSTATNRHIPLFALNLYPTGLDYVAIAASLTSMAYLCFFDNYV